MLASGFSHFMLVNQELIKSTELIMDISFNFLEKNIENFVLYLKQRQIKLFKLALNNPTCWDLCQICHGG